MFMQSLDWSGNRWWEWTSSHELPTQQNMTTSQSNCLLYMLIISKLHKLGVYE